MPKGLRASDTSAHNVKPASSKKEKKLTKTEQIKGNMETFLDEMFSVYNEKGGKDFVSGLLLNPKYGPKFIEEFFALSRKYMDMKIAEMRIMELNNQKSGGMAGQVIQNTFIIEGLYDGKAEMKQTVKQIAGEGKVEFEFEVQGL